MSGPPDDEDLTRLGETVGGMEPEARPVSRDRYRLGRSLGEGGMAVVVEAEDTTLRRPVAVKRLRAELQRDRGARQRFFDEAEIMAALDHPGLVAVHDAGVLGDGQPFYAMAKVRGRTFDSLLGRDAAAGLRVSMRFIDIFQRVAETMGFAHANEIVHRDLKPENIMVDDHGAVYVMDWGIAKRIGGSSAADESLRTVTGVIMGTPSYMSPEVARGESHAADARTDVFSLGVILYQILTGRRPFKADTAEGVVAAVREHSPPEPRRVNRQAPRELSAICMKALSKDPNGRYPTARELAEDIRNYRGFLPVSAVQPTLRDRARNWVRRHPRLSAALATAAGAMLLGALVVGYRSLSDRLVFDGVWTRYERIQADIDGLQRSIAEEDARPLTDLPEGTARRRAEVARTERQERLEVLTADARTTLTALFGLTYSRPDQRVISEIARRMHEEIARSVAEGDFVKVKVQAETRLEAIEHFQGQFGGRLPWPAEETGYLRATLERANGEIERQIAGRPSGEP